MERYIRYNPSIGQIYSDIFDFFKITNDGSIIINIDTHEKDNYNVIIPYQIEYPYLKYSNNFYKEYTDFIKIENEFNIKFDENPIIYIINGFIGENENIEITIRTNTPERALYFRNLVLDKNILINEKKPLLNIQIYDLKYFDKINYLNYNTNEIYFFDANIFNFKKVLLFYLANIKLYYCNFVNSYNILKSNDIVKQNILEYENFIYLKTLILNNKNKKYILCGNNLLLDYIQNEFIFTNKYTNIISKNSSGYCSLDVNLKTFNNLFNSEDFKVNEFKYYKNIQNYVKYNSLLQNVKYNQELNKIFYNNIMINDKSNILLGNIPNMSKLNLDLRFDNFYFFIETNNCLFCNKIYIEANLMVKILLLGLNKVKFINNSMNVLYDDDYLLLNNNEYCNYNDKKKLYDQLLSILNNKKCYLILSKINFKNHSRRNSRRSTDDLIQVESNNFNYNTFDDFIIKRNFRNKTFIEQDFNILFDTFINIVRIDFNNYLVK
jgi:hypothetical protein